VPSFLEKILPPLTNSTQTGARLAELQALHQTASEHAEAVFAHYAELIEKSITSEADDNALAKAKAKHKDAADQMDMLADRVAAAQRKHDAALEAEERARRVELWHQVTELSRKRTEATEKACGTIATLSRQIADVARLGRELAEVAPFRADTNGGAAKLYRDDLASLVDNELYRTGVTRKPGNDSLLGDRPVMVDVLRDAEQFILQLRNEALRGA
jgi:hypothetical protein